MSKIGVPMNHKCT